MGTPKFEPELTPSRRIYIALSFLFLMVLGLALHQALHEDRIRVIVKTEKTTGSPGSIATRPSLGPSNKNEITGSSPGSTLTPSLSSSNKNGAENEPDVKVINTDKCPSEIEIEPCKCTEFGASHEQLWLLCSGDTVTQANVDRLFNALRYANNVSSWADPWIVIDKFSLTSTNMTNLDLTPLIKVEATWITILDNKLLENMTSPFEPTEENGGFINASKLVLINTPCFNNSWANNMLKYFVSPSMTHLILDSSGISDSSISVIEDWSGGLEFVAGLSRFTNLTSLSLEGNHISKLPGGILSRHSKLGYLDLRNNGMEKMDKYSLFFNGSKKEDDDGNQSVTLVIDLSDNNLTNENLAMDLGLGGIRRATLLMLGGNPLETLEREMFEKFLRHNNSLSLTRDPKIICDSKVSWLREGIQEFRNRVNKSDCSNDVGRNVFNSRYSL